MRASFSEGVTVGATVLPPRSFVPRGGAAAAATALPVEALVLAPLAPPPLHSFFATAVPTLPTLLRPFTPCETTEASAWTAPDGSASKLVIASARTRIDVSVACTCNTRRVSIHRLTPCGMRPEYGT